ncbi:MaoC/PaaZ C-terminal domain-containing protein [Ruegeria arenilitoris]|uniref:MaoC/PaaZ C-terminal domain-containing protein n=1 Tax=Ruegeria arenilitoris TaxID=1173585 RepID=UPI00147D987A|nr:MaoC/PaaZ C-terminal domain-containing protein [Ruegeria arenilitoris]
MAERAALNVGESVTSRSARLTREAAIGFAQEFDPQPMHINDAAAQDGFFGKLVASGWHALRRSKCWSSGRFGPPVKTAQKY